jgi:hypothetical protein
LKNPSIYHIRHVLFTCLRKHEYSWTIIISETIKRDSKMCLWTQMWGYLISNPVPCSHWYHFSVGIRISRFIFVILTSKLTSHLRSQTHFGIPFYRFRYYNGSWIFMFAKACKQNMSNVVNWWVFNWKMVSMWARYRVRN